jgi:hypothetical protein
MPTTSFITTNSEATRMAVAVGRDMRLGRNATAQEVKDFWAGRMRSFVLESERRASRESYESSLADTPFEPT